MAKTPSVEDIKLYFQQNAVMGQTGRARLLDKYESFYATTQYAHQPMDWWGLSADQTEAVSTATQVPPGFTQPAMQLSVRDKRPTAPYHLAKAVVDRFTGMLFGETRRPDIEVEGDPDTDDFIHACMEQMRWWPKWREARTMGGAAGSVLVTFHLKGGAFQMLTHNPKHVQILWKDRRALEPLAALIMFTYPKEVLVRDRKTGETRAEIVLHLYRRLITHMDDTVYEEAKLDGAEIPWDVQECANHNLGRFPGVWVQNKPVAENEDGEPDCHGQWNTFDTIDRLTAQMNKAVLANCDPTLALKIDRKELMAMGGSVKMGSDNAINLGSSGDAKFLEITAAGVQAAAALIKQLKQNALDVSRCVLLEPAEITGAAQSAKAIEYIMSPMLEQGDDLRSQWGDTGLIPALKIVEDMARVWHGRKVQITKPDGQPMEAITKIMLPRKTDGTERVLGTGGWIRLKWGAYFKPSEQDKEVTVRTLLAAKQGGALDNATLVSLASVIFGVQDPAAMLERIKAEQEEEATRMMGGAIPEIPPAVDDVPPPSNEIQVGTSPPPAAPATIELTPSMQGAIITVNQALSQLGLPPWPGEDGQLTIVEFQAKHSGTIAAAANAEGGVSDEGP
jgi:hypothetical protein